MSAISPLDLEWSNPGESVNVQRYFIQWRRASEGSCRQTTVAKCTPSWRDVMCDINYYGGTKSLEQARAVMRGLQDGRDPAREVEWRLLKRNFEITAEVVE